MVEDISLYNSNRNSGNIVQEECGVFSCMATVYGTSAAVSRYVYACSSNKTDINNSNNNKNQITKTKVFVHVIPTSLSQISNHFACDSRKSVLNICVYV